ncbi:MAG: hypothetical protein ACK5A0_14390 [Polaromonas sp.]|jgi:hypothetical protein
MKVDLICEERMMVWGDKKQAGNAATKVVYTLVSQPDSSPYACNTPVWGYLSHNTPKIETALMALSKTAQCA